MTPRPNARQALWLQRVRSDLPTAARAHPDWPIRLDHCFARVILDAVCGRPWREAVAPPAWLNLPPERLEAAIGLAGDILAGRADLEELNRASLRARRATRARAAALLALSGQGRSVSSPTPAGTRPAGTRTRTG